MGTLRIPFLVHLAIFACFIWILNVCVFDPLESIVAGFGSDEAASTFLQRSGHLQIDATTESRRLMDANSDFDTNEPLAMGRPRDYEGSPLHGFGTKLEHRSEWESHRVKAKDITIAWARIHKKISEEVVHACVRIAVQFLFALIYKRQVVDRKGVLTAPIAGPGYRSGCCDCFQDVHVCFTTWCCFPARMADTYHATGLLDFWLAAILATFCLPCFLWCIMPCNHAQIRGRLGGHAECSCQDFCLVFWCGLCVGCQEARSVDEALGVRTRCCCELQPLDETRMPLVGEAVTLQHGQILSGHVVATTAQGFAPPVLQPPPLPWHPAVQVQQGYVVQAVQSEAPTVQPQVQQALQFSGREVRIPSQAGLAVSQNPDTELQPLTEQLAQADEAHQ